MALRKPSKSFIGVLPATQTLAPVTLRLPSLGLPEKQKDSQCAGKVGKRLEVKVLCPSILGSVLAEIARTG